MINRQQQTVPLHTRSPDPNRSQESDSYFVYGSEPFIGIRFLLCLGIRTVHRNPIPTLFTDLNRSQESDFYFVYGSKPFIGIQFLLCLRIRTVHRNPISTLFTDPNHSQESDSYFVYGSKPFIGIRFLLCLRIRCFADQQVLNFVNLQQEKIPVPITSRQNQFQTSCNLLREQNPYISDPTGFGSAPCKMVEH